MKTSIDYLPEQKQKQLRKVVQIAVDAVNPEKVILFGSHARDRWVEEVRRVGNRTHEYISDYDILVITRKDEKRTDNEVEDMLEARCDKFATPVSVIAHPINYVNARLSEGQYFFSDIKEEGILLYDAGNIPLAEARDLTPAERKAIAINDFNHWYGDAVEFMANAMFSADRKLNIAAFMLHQATERAYAAALLVYTGYKPRIHNLGKLLHMCKEFTSELAPVFPRDTKMEEHLYQLLKKAYIDARYKKTYFITREELDILTERVKQTHVIVERICMAKIAAYDTIDH